MPDGSLDASFQAVSLLHASIGGYGHLAVELDGLSVLAAPLQRGVGRIFGLPVPALTVIRDTQGQAQGSTLGNNTALPSIGELNITPPLRLEGTGPSNWAIPTRASPAVSYLETGSLSPHPVWVDAGRGRPFAAGEGDIPLGLIFLRSAWLLAVAYLVPSHTRRSKEAAAPRLPSQLH